MIAIGSMVIAMKMKFVLGFATVRDNGNGLWFYPMSVLFLVDLLASTVF